MKPNKEILDFLNDSDNDSIKITSKSKNVSFNIIKQKINTYTLLYEIRSMNLHNRFIPQMINPIFLLDKDNEIVYAPDEFVCPGRGDIIFNITNDDLPETQNKLKTEVYIKSAELKKEITKDVYKILTVELSSLDKKILDTIDLDYYKDEAIKKYKSGEKIIFPIQEDNILLSPEAIITYLEDKSKLKNIVFDCIDDELFKKYEKYVAENKCIDDYIKKLETNPLFTRQSAMQAIIENDKQSYSITYHDQTGKCYKESFKKPSDKINLITHIYDYNLFNGIPIELIDKITWKNTVLYDTTKYEPITITEKETAKRLFSLNKIPLIAPKYKVDKDVLKAAIIERPTYFNCIPYELKHDEDFILDIMKDIKVTGKTLQEITNTSLYFARRRPIQTKCFIFEHLDKYLINDKNFLTKYLNLLSYDGFQLGSDKYKNEILSAMIKYTKSYEFSKLCINAIGIDKDLFGIIPEEFLNRKNMLDFLKNVEHEQGKKDHTLDVKLSKTLLPYLTNIENLEYMFDDETIKNNIAYVHDDVLIKRDYIFDHLSKNALSNNRIITQYSKDKDMINKIVEYTDEDQVINVLNLLGVGAYDSVRKFELCSTNIVFLSELSKEEMMIFMEGELEDIENITTKEENIIITTPNCILNLNGSNISISNKNSTNFYEFPRKGAYKDNLKDVINDILHKKYKLSSTKYEAAVAEVIKQNINNDKER